MKIYTKKGDKGNTSLLGGKIVPKDYLRIEVYGTIDELNAHIGYLRVNILDKKLNQILVDIQEKLFIAGSNIAAEPNKKNIKIPELTEIHIENLEKQIDQMNNQLPELKSFVLPGGNEVVSICHIARCVCRRAERNTVSLAKMDSVNPIWVKYLNRLSDYLFTLSRFLSKELGAEEIPWQSGE